MFCERYQNTWKQVHSLQMRRVQQLILFWRTCDALLLWHPNIFFLTLRWTAFVNYTVWSNVDASTRMQTRRSSCQILSSNWICAGMLIYYGMFPWNINSDLGNRLGLFSGDKLQTSFISWDLSEPKWTPWWHISDWSDISHIWGICTFSLWPPTQGHAALVA